MGHRWPWRSWQWQPAAGTWPMQCERGLGAWAGRVPATTDAATNLGIDFLSGARTGGANLVTLRKRKGKARPRCRVKEGSPFSVIRDRGDEDILRGRSAKLVEAMVMESGQRQRERMAAARLKLPWQGG